MSDIAIQFKDVAKRFGPVTAIEGINFEIKKGELVTFLGPSGCGKTTSLRLVAGLELPSSGTVKIAGEDVSKKPAEDRNVGMVFQSYALFPHMTVLDNVMYGPAMRGVNKRITRERSFEVLSLMGLEGMEERQPTELSGGQQQRVAVARAIVQQPDVLLFDEPLSNVDAKLRRKVRNEIRDLQMRYKLTAVYVTHDQEEALAVSDRIVVMKNGRIAQIGTPRDLYERPNSRFVADFIGDANLIEGTIRRERGGCSFIAGTMNVELDKDYPAGKAVIAVRPESLIIANQIGDSKVRTVVYLGSKYEYNVTAPFGEVLVSTAASGDPIPAGTQVSLSIEGPKFSVVEHA